MPRSQTTTRHTAQATARAGFVTLCQQLLALGVVLAALVPATNIVSLDIVREQPGAGRGAVDAGEGTRYQGALSAYVQHLKNELAERLADAGVQVIDARISHLAYAAEIAQAMLQRQQANAVIAARTRIVAGAVGMVEMALAELQKNGVVQLDEERKAHMVSNLLTVLCSDRGTQPIVNAGSLY